jgi:hypothetical protein|tara:strand:+ start:152 stop:511 length:360 start_codon:yes stop_codon:yes gene_type:complete
MKLLNKFNLINAYAWTILSTILVNGGSNQYCGARYSFNDYCNYYEGIYRGFFADGSNTFGEIFIFSLIIVLCSFVLESLTTAIISKKEVHTDMTIKQLIKERLIQIPFVIIFIWGLGLY